MPFFFRSLIFFLFLAIVPPVHAENQQVSVLHYFSDNLGHAGIKAIFEQFTAQKKIQVVENPVGHEDFKNVVLQMAAEKNLPDVISYWAGARTQFMVEAGALAPLDQLWQDGGFGRLIPDGIVSTATRYENHRYLVPFGYHAVGVFYNPAAFQKAGISAPPQTWQEFLQACEKLQQVGIKPLALGARNRWPAQFWFDYLLLRIAGVDFRQKLMIGQASYLDPLVLQTMETWGRLIEQNFFSPGLLSDDWTDAADRVASGQAGMTLMGTWLCGYWNNKGLKPGSDYDFFPFPTIDPTFQRVVIGPVDGLVVAANSQNLENAGKLIGFLLTDLDSQRQWALAQGALSPNRQVPRDIYSSVLQKALAEVESAAVFAFSYDLATSPPVAELGLTLFSSFLEDPKHFQRQLERTAELAELLLKRKTSE